MVKVKVIEVYPGAEYENRVYDYWVKCELQNGETILLFDYGALDLRGKVNKSVNCIIRFGFVSTPGDESCTEIVRGKVLAQVELPSLYGIGDFTLSRDWIGLETVNGVFLIEAGELPKIVEGSSATVCVGRYYLLGYEK